VAGIKDAASTNALTVIVEQQFHNTWNYSAGANFHLNELWMFRFGGGYDQSPANNRYRSVQFPDSDRVALAVGAHYQPTKKLGFDVGYTRVFVINSRVDNLAQTVGDEVVTSNGTIKSGANVFGLQVKWDMV
jgi:long-chain fatty acid transport protein